MNNPPNANPSRPPITISSSSGASAVARRLAILRNHPSNPSSSLFSSSSLTSVGHGTISSSGSGVGKGSSISSNFVPKSILKTKNHNHSSTINDQVLNVAVKCTVPKPNTMTKPLQSKGKLDTKTFATSSRPSSSAGYEPRKPHSKAKDKDVTGTGTSKVSVKGTARLRNEVSGGTNMRQLLENLHQSRMQIEKDQRDYEKTRREIDKAYKTIAKLQQDSKTMSEKQKELMNVIATKKTNLSYVEIRNKVVNDSLQNAETELSEILAKLHNTRMKTSSLSSKGLSSAIQFALLFNGTKLGWRSRRAHFSRLKQKLESELEDFLYMIKGTDECTKEKEALEKKNSEIKSKENEMIEKIQSLDLRNKELEEQECSLLESFDEEYVRLRQQIQERQKAVAILQTKAKEMGTTARTQSNLTKNPHRSNENSGMGNRFGKSLDVSRGGCVRGRGQLNRGAQNRQSFESRSLPKFQTPLRPQFETTQTSTKPIDSEAMSDFGESNDEDLCFAAAAEVSQRMRTYEPVTPTPTYNRPLGGYGSPPSKVRVVERQLPITSFMKQLSTQRVLKPKRPKNPAFQAKASNPPEQISAAAPPARTSLGTSKIFQFKKKSTNSYSEQEQSFEKENLEAKCDFPSFPVNGDESAFSDVFLDEAICSFEENQNSNTNSLFDNMPYSTFNSSRILLTESQEQKLLS